MMMVTGDGDDGDIDYFLFYSFFSSNGVYGKLLNVRPKLITKWCTNRIDALKYLSAHNFKSVKILNENSSVFLMDGESTLVSKPFITGYVILEMSKLKMYSTYYDVLKPNIS